MLATLRQIVAQQGKLYSWVAAWIGSYSTAARTSNPACSNPSERPPAPANRSTPIGLCRIPLFASRAHAYSNWLQGLRLGERSQFAAWQIDVWYSGACRQELLGLFQCLQCHSAGNRGEAFQKVFQCVAARQIVEQR